MIAVRILRRRMRFLPVTKDLDGLGIPARRGFFLPHLHKAI